MILFNVYNIVEENISPRLRKTFTVELLKSLASPLARTFSSFYSFFNETKYDLQFNGQVIYLEHILNDKFDDVDRGIYITDMFQTFEGCVLFNEIEQNEETIIYNEIEDSGEGYVLLYTELEESTWPDFIVNVPSAVNFEDVKMKAYLNKYKISGKQYQIKII